MTPYGINWTRLRLLPQQANLRGLGFSATATQPWHLTIQRSQCSGSLEMLIYVGKVAHPPLWRQSTLYASKSLHLGTKQIPIIQTQETRAVRIWRDMWGSGYFGGVSVHVKLP